MSKEFKTQDYFGYKRLGIRWRRPKGRQSKLRVRKSGSGRFVSIGNRTPRSERRNIPLVMNINDLLKMRMKTEKEVFLSSTLGAKKRAQIEEKAKELGLKILNKRRRFGPAKKSIKTEMKQEVK